MNSYFKIKFLLSDGNPFELKISNAYDYEGTESEINLIKNSIQDIILQDAIALPSEELSLTSVDSIIYHRDVTQNYNLENLKKK
ncbi:MAG: hypothetical protein LBJ93_02095 [Clostridiales bacterium]|jgi:hypothetical protein|nr:hypothetical protein [Clostridiales bacterium]